MFGRYNGYVKDFNGPILESLLAAAGQIRKNYFGDSVELCSIVNAKSGTCSQNCAFCAQSSHHNTNIEQYPLISKEEIVRQSQEAAKNGAKCFGIVTSGPAVSDAELDEICEAIEAIRAEGKIIPDASLGHLTEERARKLKDAGLIRYHHNLETSRSYFPKICTTHSYESRINTIKTAKDAGLEVCSGGVFGLGEGIEDRVELALTLKELDVNSVPLNFLIPVPGTKLEGALPLSADEALLTIALFRILLPDKHIKVCAGREKVLGERQKEMFSAGANGMMIGGYLTQAGRSVKEDLRMLNELGQRATTIRKTGAEAAAEVD